MAEWKEEEHPRADDGKFTDGKGFYKQNTPYSDILANGSEDFYNSNNLEDLYIPKEVQNFVDQLSDEDIRYSSGWLTGSGKEDLILKRLVSMYGFDKKPVLTSMDDVDNMVKNGAIGFTRGVKVKNGYQSYVAGDMYIGRGCHGSGVYVSLYTQSGDFETRETAMRNATIYATDKKNGAFGSIIYGCISQDAKVISESKLKSMKEKLLSKYPEKVKRVFSNNGRLALALGFDLIDCENGYAVVLNRGKTIVGEQK